MRGSNSAIKEEERKIEVALRVELSQRNNRANNGCIRTMEAKVCSVWPFSNGSVFLQIDGDFPTELTADKSIKEHIKGLHLMPPSPSYEASMLNKLLNFIKKT